jgi:tRNA-specific 2-thiouridylase
VLRDRLKPDDGAFRPGEIRDLNDALLGRHEGLAHFTVGQRRGLGLGGGESLRVIALETATNTLRVGPPDALARGGLWAAGLNRHVSDQELQEGPVEVKIRYRHRATPAEVRVARNGSGDRLHIRFQDPQSGVTPGQSCVVYRDEALLAGGRILGSCDCCPPLGP